jgi:hypothetical protein
MRVGGAPISISSQIEYVLRTNLFKVGALKDKHSVTLKKMDVLVASGGKHLNQILCCQSFRADHVISK